MGKRRIVVRMSRSLPLALVLPLTSAIAGCPQPTPEEPAAALECDEGQLEDDGSCVPEACGVGTWGALEVDGDTVYVNIEAADGGDGSAEAPLCSIQPALDLAGDRGGGLVAVAAGTYPETLNLGTDHAGVRLAGRCRELVTLDASVGDESTAGVEISALYGEIQLSGLDVVDASYLGFRIQSGVVRLVGIGIEGSARHGIATYRGAPAPVQLEIEGCELAGNTEGGILAWDSGTEVSLVDTVIRDTRPTESGDSGYGVRIQEGAALSAERCELAGNTTVGVMVHDPGAEISLVDTTIRDTQPQSEGGFGIGIIVADGGMLSAERCRLTGNVQSGITVTDTGSAVSLVDVTIQDTQQTEDGQAGYGIDVYGGAALEATRCDLQRNALVGILAYNPGTEVALADTTVRDTQPGESSGFGLGVLVTDSAALSAERCKLEGNTAAGIMAHDTGTLVTLADTTVQGTVPDGDGAFGNGLTAFGGAELAAMSCSFTGNTAEGIVAYDPGTTVLLQDSSIEDTLPYADGSFGRGLEIRDGASLTLESCEVRGHEDVGLVVAHPGTTATLRETTIRDTRNDDGSDGMGIGVQEGAALDARGCQVVGNTRVGVGVMDFGSTARLHDTRIIGTLPDVSGEVGYGVEVSGGASVLVEACEVTGNVGAGVLAAGGGTSVTLRGTTVSDTRFDVGGVDGIGVEAYDGALLAIEACEIAENRGVGVQVRGRGSAALLRQTTVRDTLPDIEGVGGFGVNVFDGASLSLDGCDLVDNISAGLLATNPGTEVVILDTSITGTRAAYGHQGATALGVGVQDEATVSASGLLAQGNEGPGLVLWVNAARLDCTDCRLLDNQFAGVVVVDGSTLELRSSTISNTEEGADLGGGVGFYAAQQEDWDPPSLLVIDSTLSDNLAAGGWLSGQGSYHLESNTFSGGIGIPHGTGTRCGDGVYARAASAWDAGSGLLLQGNTLSDNTGAGLFLDDASAALDGNLWQANTPDLLVQGEACLSPGDDWAEAPSSEICPAWDRPSCDLEFHLSLDIEDIVTSRPPPPTMHPVPLAERQRPPTELLEMVVGRLVVQ